MSSLSKLLLKHYITGASSQVFTSKDFCGFLFNEATSCPSLVEIPPDIPDILASSDDKSAAVKATSNNGEANVGVHD